MRITLLELVGCKRLIVRNIEHFVIQPTEPQQLLLGTNGSGKSFVLNELTPLPAMKDDYTKEGSKTIEIAHRGSKYILKSWFQPKANHSFVKDGEELNPGGTVTVQKDLVYQEFGIDDETHELTLGLLKFHQMNPTDKRRWFTRLSDVSYDFAIKLYNTVNSKHRDAVGSLRTAKSQLVEESNKLMNDAEEKKLRDDVALLQSEMKLLLEQRNSRTQSVQSAEEAYRQTGELIQSLARRIIKMAIRKPAGGECQDVSDIERVIDQHKQSLAAKQSILNHHVDEHGKLEKAVQALIKAGDDGVAALRDKIPPLRQQRDTALAMRVLKLEGIEPVEGQRALETAFGILQETLRDIPANEDRRFSQASLHKAREKRTALKDEEGQVLTAISRLEAKQAHLDSHRGNTSTECPKCRFVWVQGFSEEAYSKLVERISAGGVRRTELESQIANVEAEIQLTLDYAAQYREFTRAVESFPILEPFWSHLLEDNLVAKAPRQALSKMEQLRGDLAKELEAYECNVRIAEIEKIIASALEAGDADVEEAAQRLHALEEKIGELTAEVRRLQNSLNEYSTFRTQVLEAQEMGRRLEELMVKYETQNVEQIEALRQETLERVINSHSSMLGRKEHALREADRQRQRVEMLKENAEHFERDAAALALLVSNLSPKEGLIAEGLMGFIRNFTAQMNNLIRKVWTYPLQVLPCGGSDGVSADLDYKFPLLVQTKSNIVPDVKYASVGQKEMIDFAFMVVARRYLGLMEAPLFLDEFGQHLDEAHRTSAMVLIKSLMEQQAFPQLFMVSHYASTHGSMTNAEICVLDPSNITVPTKYNQHVVIH